MVWYLFNKKVTESKFKQLMASHNNNSP
jgi:hypothetical protein